ncbi:hypothetical protein DFH09DRAFT_1285310 [Mycena vulgaris]|nr:hypothetical protein DFH09DRAFT_1285310 [Mycena vulgaris]
MRVQEGEKMGRTKEAGSNYVQEPRGRLDPEEIDEEESETWQIFDIYGPEKVALPVARTQNHAQYRQSSAAIDANTRPGTSMSGGRRGEGRTGMVEAGGGAERRRAGVVSRESFLLRRDWLGPVFRFRITAARSASLSLTTSAYHIFQPKKRAQEMPITARDKGRDNKPDSERRVPAIKTMLDDLGSGNVTSMCFLLRIEFREAKISLGSGSAKFGPYSRPIQGWKDRYAQEARPPITLRVIYARGRTPQNGQLKNGSFRSKSFKLIRGRLPDGMPDRSPFDLGSGTSVDQRFFSSGNQGR